MIRMILMACMLTASTLVALSPTAAQERAPEIGFDVAFTSIGSNEDGSVRLFEVPRWIRVGAPIGERALFEVAATWRRVSTEGGSSSSLELRPSVSWLWGEEGAARPYVSAATGLSRVGPGGDQETQGSLGMAGGVRTPLGGGAVLRFEAGFDRVFESDERDARNHFRLGLGVSVAVR